MSAWIRHDLPADIEAFAGEFGSGAARQPKVFAHLMTVARKLDFDGVEVIGADTAPDRLQAYFPAPIVADLLQAAAPETTIVLILPTAYDGLVCPLGPTEHLRPLGTFRGTVPKLIARGDAR